MKTRLVRSPQTAAPPHEATLRAELEAEGFRVTRYSYPPGTRFPPHQHAVDKCDVVVSGHFAMSIAGVEQVLTAGDRMYVAAGDIHDARVLGTTPVISLDGERRNR